MPKGQRGSLHATRRAKRSCNCREDGDYDVEDFTPGAVVVECSHSLVRGPTLPVRASQWGLLPSQGTD